MSRRSGSGFLLAALFAALAAAAPSLAAAPPPPDAPIAVERAVLERWQAAYGRAATWLVEHQNPNGSFGQIPDEPEPGEVGITALALRALAEAPEPWRTRHAAAAARAAEYIATRQRDDGAIVSTDPGLTVYRTSCAIMALAAYDRDRYRDVLSRARGYLERSQHQEASGMSPESPHHGGFGYDHGGSAYGDLSNTGMALEALRRAGLPADSPALERARRFISRCQNRSESNPGVAGVHVADDGGFIYDPGLSRRHAAVVEHPDGTVELVSYASMTYTGLLSLLHAEVSRDDPRVQAAVRWIREHYTLEENNGLGTRDDPERGQDGLYYYFYTFARALDAFGQARLATSFGEERAWAPDLLDKLESVQCEDGSFVNERGRWWERDPVLCTCYGLNAMNAALRNVRAP